MCLNPSSCVFLYDLNMVLNEMDGACSTYVGKERCRQGFGGEN